MTTKLPHNKFVRIITVPFRALSKAKAFYIRSMTDCTQGMPSGGGNYGHAALPRSFSAASSMSGGDGDDYRELLRAASVRTLGHRSEVEMLLEEKLKEAAARRLPKSCSVGMGRIDEDNAEEFVGVEEVNVGTGKKADLRYPRSRSYAVVTKTTPLAD